MNLQQYRSLWDRLQDPLYKTLVALRETLAGNPEFERKLEFSPLEIDAEADDCFVSFTISDIRGAEARLIVEVEFALYENPAGANICLTVDDLPRVATAFAYTPYKGMKGADTLDLAELQDRIATLPFDTMVKCTEELLREFLEKPARE